MGFKINPSTGEIGIDYPQLKELLGDSLNAVKSMVTKVSDARESKQIEEFLAYRNFLTSHRKLAADLAGVYYRDRGFEVLDEGIPILFKEQWIPSTPIDLREVRLDWQPCNGYDFDRSIFAREDILPFGERRYSSPLKSFVKDIMLYNDATYRLMEVEVSEKNNYVLRFELDDYFNYVDTCELLAYEFCKTVIKRLKEKAELATTSIKDKVKLTLRGQIEPFDFTNRSAAVGINTALIVLDNKKPSRFYLHERGEKLVESTNTISVVPAGTFQPRHRDDTYHSQDFNLYTNLMREFAEELLGEEEFRESRARLTDIFEIDILKKMDFFVKRGLIKVYYLGMGLDCLTTKPEILTALVLEREIFDTFIQREFVDCFEGKYFEIEFSPDQLRKFTRDKRIVPAGAACLWLIEKNFDFFRSTV